MMSLLKDNHTILKLLLSLITSVVIFSDLNAQQPYWQQELQYQIDVKLDDTAHTLDGFMKLQYTNHSPDSLSFIWFHLWPNAYKTDRTAFSDQLLENGRTDFYFSNADQRGYINRLDFRINDTAAQVETDPMNIEELKVLLSSPLPPGGTISITTPFHVQLPHVFSRSGHTGQDYNITQWYPKPAVYDKSGWHPMPYLDQGEFYSEFGSYDVRITIPANYIVAATGNLQNADEMQSLKKKTVGGKDRFEHEFPEIRMQQKGLNKKRTEDIPATPPSSTETKTLHYIQDRVHDFAWFASKEFIVDHDTLQLASGKTIDVFAFYHSFHKGVWKNAVSFAKQALQFRSQTLGEYPYDVASVVEGPLNFDGGMEYPTITVIKAFSDKSLDMVIEHELGHNWFYGVLASNERRNPWMDEGMNSYYDRRYMEKKYGDNNMVGAEVTAEWLRKRMPEDEEELLLNWITAIHKDQPISLPSAEFTEMNYGAIVYLKTARWMEYLEKIVGTELFDSCMKQYYQQWQFKHPSPEDFKQFLQQCSGKDLATPFALLDTKGPVTPPVQKKTIKPAFLFNLHNTDSIHYINWMPALGFNVYDKLMVGLLIHNYNVPPSRFTFLIAPLYATGSKQFNGIGSFHYTSYPDKNFQKIIVGFGVQRFSSLEGVDSSNNKINGYFFRLTPSLKLVLKNKTARSSLDKYIEWKTFFVGERGFDYQQKTSDSIFYPVKGKLVNRHVNQLTFSVTDYRVLYPYDASLQLQPGKEFFRANLEANYLFNYPSGGGLRARFFGAAFAYLNGANGNSANARLYQPKLTAVRGSEDYTYSNYFIGRNEFEGFTSQQMMMRDGGLKLRTDLFDGYQGRSEKWIAAMNFNTTLPNKLFPIKLPIRLFFDVGTYAEAWKKDAITSRFLYVGGLQVTLFSELLNVYMPLVYSKEFRDNFKSVPEENSFGKKISFSIDIHRFNLRRISRNKIPL
jgi:hypothetical protein